MLALSSSKANRLKGLRVGSSSKAVTARLRRGRRYRVGRSTVYVARGSKARIVVELRRGRVAQIGLAGLAPTLSTKRTRLFIRRFF